ncbi:NADH dehydrogenase subunit 6 (mitochondrion) [Pieris rapae]|uniref:NADH-ubiquinone oxidoreductase chain 6 n=1 Tax=Pieris rapae TaxID=64459 RepID=G0WKL9_PIERA|nr:NADH dehydrogenase subunit 6 [Pieris rapae]ADG95356.1 NADH dehydrogenase subunit 6 [Pieris rapae]AJG02603.1 NADH dehydrogenase subunit 6 [Pieris rapae]UXX44641.1 NADH dehydrogenase subunit 6 [Pieris rapae]UXX44654.1 NADH dehydrogenase subunit 6 [Pieris rapae]UXX44667.1 NADH dehydrogenase subunit 6 [Pieris rapae]
MLFFFLTMMIFISFVMLFSKHPLSMGLMIITQTLILSLILGVYINTYWFSYILFLVFLGGLLVLFIYVSSIASNEMMNFSFKMKLFFLLMINMMMILSILKMKNYFNFIDNFINNEMNEMTNYFLFFNENKIKLSKLYNSQTFLMIMMIIIYLFITLIAIIKITNIFFGPLRSFN